MSPVCPHLEIKKCECCVVYRCTAENCTYSWNTYEKWLKEVWEPLRKTHEISLKLAPKTKK